MEKLKTMWNGFSKKGKIGLTAVVIIALIVIYTDVL